MGDMARTPEEKERIRKARDERYGRNLAWLKKVKGYEVKEVTPYQFRFLAEGVSFMDLYPTNQRYHNLITGERGRYKTAQGFLDLVYKKLSGETSNEAK